MCCVFVTTCTHCWTSINGPRCKNATPRGFPGFASVRTTCILQQYAVHAAETLQSCYCHFCNAIPSPKPVIGWREKLIRLTRSATTIRRLCDVSVTERGVELTIVLLLGNSGEALRVYCSVHAAEHSGWEYKTTYNNEIYSSSIRQTSQQEMQIDRQK